MLKQQARGGDKYNGKTIREQEHGQNKNKGREAKKTIFVTMQEKMRLRTSYYYSPLEVLTICRFSVAFSFIIVCDCILSSTTDKSICSFATS